MRPSAASWGTCCPLQSAAQTHLQAAQVGVSAKCETAGAPNAQSANGVSGGPRMKAVRRDMSSAVWSGVSRRTARPAAHAQRTLGDEDNVCLFAAPCSNNFACQPTSCHGDGRRAGGCGCAPQAREGCASVRRTRSANALGDTRCSQHANAAEPCSHCVRTFISVLDARA